MVYGFIAVVWVVLFGRLIPDLHRDHSVFVSVAERLIAGDRLYSGVWDNKDPLFYWTLALGRSITPYADVIIEILWLLIACISVRSILRHLSLSNSVSILFAYGVTPIILTGGMYVPGLTHLPAEALIFVAIAFAMNQRIAFSGVAIATLAMAKLVLVPVGLIAVATILFLRRTSQPLKKTSGSLILGFGSGLAVWSAVLLYRSEFSPYLNAQKLNFLYANSQAGRHALTDSFGPIFRHFLQSLSISALIILIVATSYLVLTKFDIRNRFKLKSLPEGQNTIWYLSVVTLFASAGVLFVSGIWPHHGQVYYVPAVFVAILFVSRQLENVQTISLKTLLVFALVGVIFGGVIYPTQYVQSARDATKSLEMLNQVSPLTQELLKRSPNGTYARAGSNNDLGHAFGLRNWKLACYRFNQYSFDPEMLLEKDADCLSKATYILVTPGQYEQPNPATQSQEKPTPPAFQKYLEQLRAMLAKSYKCQKYSFTADPDASGYVCEKLATE